MDTMTSFNKNFNTWFLNDVLRAVRRYDMIREAEKVCVALSGGRDSITLLYILYYMNKYSPLKFDLSALHIKTDEYDTAILRQFCHSLNIPYDERSLIYREKPPKKNICSICSRLKRGATSDFLKKNGIRKVAFGHHAQDVVETFFMNILQNKKLGSFSPRVAFDNNPMIIIRPLIYLDNSEIRRIHRYLGLPALDFTCTYAEKNIRSHFRQCVANLDACFKTRNFSRKLVDSLEHVDTKNRWEDLFRPPA
jgi:tRNA(Ile)-lysidine synthase TilS/MesJ